MKPYDIASSLHVHHIKTTKHCITFITKLLLGYADFITDIICVVFLYNSHGNFPTAFTLAIMALLLPSIIMILLPRQDYKSRILTLLRFRQTYEAIISWKNELETIEYCLVELIESVGGGFASSLIQLYAILYRTSYESDHTFDLLGPEYILYISISISILNSSWSSTRLFTTNEERHRSRTFYCLLFTYYYIEKIYRLLYFCIIGLFLTSGGYQNNLNPYLLNGLFLLISIFIRCIIIHYSHHQHYNIENNNNKNYINFENVWNFIGKLLLSLATSHIFVGEYVLSCRFLILEFFEFGFLIPFFLWLQNISNYEKTHFNAYIPILLALSCYIFKMLLLIGRLYYTPHARHVLYNHSVILVYEAVIVLLAVVCVWAILIAITFSI